MWYWRAIFHADSTASEPPHLFERGLADLLAVRVPDVDGEEPRERVEVTLALVVPEVTALSAHDDRRLVLVHPGEVQPQVVARRCA
jgi:hypothetical protein